MNYQDSHLHLDFQNEFVAVDYKPLKLSPKEYELLAMLVRHAGEVVPRDVLLLQVWGYGESIRTRTLDVHVRRLRSKLEHCRHRYIETIFNVGYRFQPHRAQAVPPLALAAA